MQKDDTREIIAALLKPEGSPKNFVISLEDFKILFREIQTKRKGTTVDIVFNGKWAFVQFSELCNHRIRVLPNNFFNPIKRFLHIGVYIEREDFEIAESVAQYYGQEEYLSGWRFLKEEIVHDGLPGFIVFLFMGVLLTWLASSSGDIDVIKTVNDLVIGIATIFFSIFMLFTASQNLSLLEDTGLFRSGLTHRFIQVDKMVAWIAIAALTISVVNRVLAESKILNSFLIPIPGFDLTIKHFIIWTSALAVSLIFISFFIVVRYYMRRVENLINFKLSKQILDDAYEERNSNPQKERDS